VTMAPSVSYSITVRLEVASRGRAVSEITRAVEHSGGVVTALDVTAGRNDRLRGAVHEKRPGLNPSLRWIAEHTNRDGYAGDLRGAINGADVFIGLSAPHILTAENIKTMAADSIVFALANPEPEVDPDAASEHAAVVATGRSDYPNQINNVLAFPGVVPRAARRAEPAHLRRHADRRRAGAGRRGLARRDRPALHHPVGLPSGCDLIGRGGGPRCRHRRT
jgi:hypothetical protein